MREENMQLPTTGVGSDDSPFGHGVPMDWRAKPPFMYLHYLGDEKEPVQAYLFQIVDPESGITEGDISQAIDSVQRGAAAPLRRSAHGVQWRVLSYMVFVLGDLGEEFDADAIKFQHEISKKNHTFLDAHIYRDTNSGCSVFYCTNFRRKRSGQVLGNISEKYTWISDHSRGTKGVEVHSDSGQNTGP